MALEIVVDNELFTESFWIELRKRTEVGRLDVVGRQMCFGWCEDVIGILNAEHKSHDFELMKAPGSEKVTVHKITSHYWFERLTRKGAFVADGTAGQIDPSLPNGYYGFIYEAPRVLQDIYYLGSPYKYQ
ncbi:hypothetical protein KY360_02455 [Candidatus Woesearchaeota archaeon]|nr:hypothetical protein [Candidatus Woesearchaeota archaeon]